MSDTSYNIMVGEEKVGTAYEADHFCIESDKQCTDIINKLLTNMQMKPKERRILNKCLKVLTAEDGVKFNFGPGDIIILADMAIQHPNECLDINAVSNYIINILDFEGDVEEHHLDSAIAAMAKMGGLLSGSK